MGVGKGRIFRYNGGYENYLRRSGWSYVIAKKPTDEDAGVVCRNDDGCLGYRWKRLGIG